MNQQLFSSSFNVDLVGTRVLETDFSHAALFENLLFLGDKEDVSFCTWNETVVNQQLDLTFLKTLNFSARCHAVWKTTINGTPETLLAVGGWDHSITLWGSKLNLTCYLKNPHNKYWVISMCVWHGQLVTGDMGGTVHFWKVKYASESSEKKTMHSLVLLNSLKSPSPLNGIYGLVSFHTLSEKEATLWVGYKNSSIKIWNKELKVVKEINTNHASGVFSMIQWRDHVATGGHEDDVVNVWSDTGECVLVISGAGEGGPVSNMVVWNGYLFTGGLHALVTVWNFAGTKVAQLRTNCYSLVTWKDYIFTTSYKVIQAWKVSSSWNKLRVLWMGWSKNDPECCHLAKLPREIFEIILRYITSNASLLK